MREYVKKIWERNEISISLNNRFKNEMLEFDG